MSDLFTKVFGDSKVKKEIQEESNNKVNVALMGGIALQIAFAAFVLALWGVVRDTLPKATSEERKLVFTQLGESLIESWLKQFEAGSVEALQKAIDALSQGDSVVDKFEREELERRKGVAISGIQQYLADYKDMSQKLLEMLETMLAGLPADVERPKPC